MPVKQLSNSLIKLISCTQTISSLSSVVKELLENAIDAGASIVDIKLVKNGLDKIEVRDNGSGISKSDIEFVCLPNYTSKICNFNDLEQICSYGFRGEALYSLCAVSQVTIVTKTEADDAARMYEFDSNGHVKDVQLSQQMKGTTVAITNLFKNIPVRKHIFETGKKSAEELKKIEKIVKLLAIIHPKLRVTLTNNRCLIWQKTAVNSLRQSFMQIYPIVITKNMDHFARMFGDISIEIMVAKRDCNVATVCQYTSEAIMFFINQRPVKDKNVEKVVLEEMANFFTSSLSHGKCPITLISLKIPSNQLDVNLEPDKTRVFIQDQEKVLKHIRECIMLHFYQQNVTNPDLQIELPLLAEINTNSPKKRKIDACEKADDVADKSTVSSKSFPSCDGKNSEKILFDDLNLSDIDFSLFEDQTPVNKMPDLPKSNNFQSSNDPEQLINSNNLENGATTLAHNESLTPSESQPMNFRDITHIAREHQASNFGGDLTSKYKPNEKGAIEESVQNSVTLSQWSRGDAVYDKQRLPGTVSIFNSSENGSQFIPQQLPVERFSQLSEVDIVKPVAKRAKKNLSHYKKLNLMSQASNRSVSSQMGRKDMAGFTTFAREMRTKIINDAPGISFAKVAGELADRWRNLQDDQKQSYKEKAAARNNTVPTNNVVLKKTITIKASMDTIKERFKTSARDTVTGNLTDFHVIGFVKEKKLCFTRYGKDVDVLSVTRLHESVLYHRYLSSTTVPLQKLVNPVKISEKTIGIERWNLLLSLSRTFTADGYSTISDPRISKNGFKIVISEHSGVDLDVTITDINKFATLSVVEELNELLDLCIHNSDLVNCRTLSVQTMLENKVIEACLERPCPLIDNEVQILWDYWKSNMPNKLLCIHNNPIAMNIHNLVYF